MVFDKTFLRNHVKIQFSFVFELKKSERNCIGQLAKEKTNNGNTQ